MSSRRDLAIRAVGDCPPEAVRAAVELCDGHTILNGKAFLSVGLPQAIVAYMTRIYQSDGSPKGTLFTKGHSVEQLSGVYGLDLLRSWPRHWTLNTAKRLGVVSRPGISKPHYMSIFIESQKRSPD